MRFAITLTGDKAINNLPNDIVGVTNESDEANFDEKKKMTTNIAGELRGIKGKFYKPTRFSKNTYIVNILL